MKTAVLYARYSSDKQREASIDDQLRVCHEFCAREGIEVLKAYTDYALSGKTDQRPEFRRMVANAPESDLVVVYMFDRFSRDRYDSIVYKRQLADCGVLVVSATEPVDRTPEGQLQEGMLEVIAAYYVADLSRKTRRGMEGNALLAKDNGYKIFGYDTDPATRRYIVNDAEAAIVREVFSRHIGGASIYGIAQDLASRGWTTVTGAPVDYNWVLRVLKRRAYTGLYSWGGIEVEDGMPMIVDMETFEAAQKVPKRKPRDGEVFALYRLTGKLFCGACGEPMHGSGGTGKSGKRYYYYVCKERGECRRRVRREFVEDAVADAVLDLTADEERMRKVARRMVELREASRDEDELAVCDARIAALEKEQHNLTSAVARGFVNDEIVERNEAIKKELAALHARRGEIAGEAFGFDEDTIVEFLAHGFDRSDEGFIFGSVVNSVYLYEDCLVVVVNMRGDDGDFIDVLVDLEQWKRKHPNDVFGCALSGVPGASTRELWVIPLTCGFGIVVPFVA
jgi:DNA invertase Pin-like site-specific DNA recombinase